MRYFNREFETADREQLQQFQMVKLRGMLAQLHGANAFYTERMKSCGAEPGDIGSIEQLRELPLTTKEALLADQAEHPPYGRNLTFALPSYTRYHQTSGTTGTPLKVLDTEQSWQWWARCWAYFLTAIGIDANERIFAAFGFGPFIGFWAAVEGARVVEALMVPGGNQDSKQRLQLIDQTRCTALFATPTYALRLAEVAEEIQMDLSGSAVRTTIHAGEPGASVPATKQRIEAAWGARCYDHAGASEVGAHSFECIAQPGGIHVNEAEFIAEVIDPDTGHPVDPGARGELVLTNLGRIGYPVIRYRTGDMVELAYDRCACGRTFARALGGIIGRRDDMLTVKGVNIYPSAIENLIRQCELVTEFRCTVTRQGSLDTLLIELETRHPQHTAEACAQVQTALHEALGLKARVEAVSADSLPRFELKAKRFFDQRPRRAP